MVSKSLFFYFFLPVHCTFPVLYSFQFDGHLVISKSFETNVDCVYAAGPVARFKGSKDDPTGRAQYDSSDVGARVADALMIRLRVVHDNDHGTSAADKLNRPLSVYCRLPGRHHYLHCAVPGPAHARKSHSTLKTGSAATGYFEIVMDNNGDVMKLSCYSKAVSLHCIWCEITIIYDYADRKI